MRKIFDFRNSFGIRTVKGLDDVVPKMISVSVTEGYDGTQKEGLGECKSLDEAISLIFEYWHNNGISCYLNDLYRLEYTSENDADQKTDSTVMVVDMGDPYVYGRISIG